MKVNEVDKYLSQFTGETRKKLDEIREIVKELAPEAKEKISYGIPTFTLHGNLVHFAGFKTHIGFYPGSGPIETYEYELSPYHTSKGTVQFPIDKPIPTEVIKKLTLAAIERNQKK